MEIENVFFVARSGNAKTGPIPATYRSIDTCPTDCPFLPANQGGCYGSGRIWAMANRKSRTITETDALATLQKAERGAKYMRDRVVGDVITTDGRFDLDYIKAIARIARRTGLKPFGYTHAWRLMTRKDVAAVDRSGYALSASCETEQDLIDAVALGLPTTLAGDSWTEGEVVAGRRIVTCPAQTRKDVNCSTCGLCAKSERTCTVRFRVHGPKRAAAASVQRRFEEAA